MKTQATAVFSNRPPESGCLGGHTATAHHPHHTPNSQRPRHPTALVTTPELPVYPHRFPSAKLTLSRQTAEVSSLTFTPRQRQRWPLLTWPPGLPGLHFLTLTGRLTTHSMLPGHGPHVQQECASTPHTWAYTGTLSTTPTTQTKDLAKDAIRPADLSPNISRCARGQLPWRAPCSGRRALGSLGGCTANR